MKIKSQSTRPRYTHEFTSNRREIWFGDLEDSEHKFKLTKSAREDYVLIEWRSYAEDDFLWLNKNQAALLAETLGVLLECEMT